MTPQPASNIDALRQKYGITPPPPQQSQDRLAAFKSSLPKAPEPGLGDQLYDRLKNFKTIATAPNPDTSKLGVTADVLRKTSHEMGNAAGIVNDTANAAFKATGATGAIESFGHGIDYVAHSIGAGLRDIVGAENADKVKEHVNKVLTDFVNQPTQGHPLNAIASGVTKTLSDPEVQSGLSDVGAVANAAGTIVGAKAAFDAAPEAAAKATEAVKAKVNPYLEARKAANAVKDAKDVDNLAGTIVQGKTADIATAKKALSTIDTTGVKSYTDLKHVLDERIGNINSKLDEALSTKTDVKKLPELQLKSTVGETNVDHNYVQDSINQLKDHYTTTNDIPKLEGIKQLEVKANSTGLTAKEINDLARQHGQDLNAFNANGQAASGLTKQAAENTRTGLKSTAREMFGDPASKAADAETTKLIKTRDLVTKVEEEVNKLQQKIKTRTWGEKLGRYAARAVNLVGLNSPKGFVEYFLGRGTGLKTLNALDLQSALQKNLTNLQEALAPNLPEADVIKRLDKIIQGSKTSNP